MNHRGDVLEPFVPVSELNYSRVIIRPLEGDTQAIIFVLGPSEKVCSNKALQCMKKKVTFIFNLKM